jgi:hypothetical protein
VGIEVNLDMPERSLHDIGAAFHLGDEAAYQRWRARKLARKARRAEDLIVDVADPKALTAAEREALLQRCADWNMAVYRGACQPQGKDVARSVGQQLGLQRLDCH